LRSFYCFGVALTLAFPLRPSKIPLRSIFLGPLLKAKNFNIWSVVQRTMSNNSALCYQPAQPSRWKVLQVKPQFSILTGYRHISPLDAKEFTTHGKNSAKLHFFYSGKHIGAASHVCR
jgi:hypothetical protein